MEIHRHSDAITMASAQPIMVSFFQSDANEEKQVIGYDDPNLLKISPVKLMQVVNSSLPGGLSSEQIRIARLKRAITDVQL